MVADEDARFAAMVVLERLTPDQRVAFVLHDGFGVPFGEIASVLGTTDAAARQLASRARRIVGEHEGPVDTRHDEAVGALMAAMAAGDMDAVIALLHPDVTFTGDSNRRTPTAFTRSPARTRWPGSCSGWPAVTVPAGSSPAGWRWSTASSARTPSAGRAATGIEPVHPRIVAVAVRDGKVAAVWDVANPDKFTGSPLARSDPPTEPGTRHQS